jgi:hypothetical protein
MLNVAFVAPQAATIFAVTTPAVLTIFETVTPFTVAEAPPFTVTLVTPTLSLTFAIVELETGDPACRALLTGLTVGAVWSATVILNEQPGPAVVVTLTGVVPIGKVDPLAGLAVTVPHEPVVVGAG